MIFDEKTLCVSMVLYNTDLQDVENCLLSIRANSKKSKIFVVDNSPIDNISAKIAKFDVKYIHNPSNPGFGGGHNLAIAKSIAENFDYHLVLNADVYFDDDVLAPMISYMNMHDDVGHMMPCIKNPDGSLQRLCKLVPTPADLLFRRLLPKSLRDKRNRHFELHDSGYNKIMYVPFLSGCFMMLRVKTLIEIGSFDERFFMYGEDVDLSRRIASRYRTMFFPEVSVVHRLGAASHKSWRMFYIHATNVARYFNKWGWLHDPQRSVLNRQTLRQFDKATGIE